MYNNNSNTTVVALKQLVLMFNRNGYLQPDIIKGWLWGRTRLISIVSKPVKIVVVVVVIVVVVFVLNFGFNIGVQYWG